MKKRNMIELSEDGKTLVKVPREFEGEFVIPEGVTTLASGAFMGCTIKELVIPKSVVSIDARTFDGCPIERIAVEDGNPIYDSRDNCNAIIETAMNRLVAGCCNTIIPDSVTCIGHAAFAFCEQIVTMNIPDSVVDIEPFAFQCCRNMEHIRLPKGLKSIAGGVFSECYKLNDISLPEGLEVIQGFSMNYSLTHITIPNSVKSLSGFSGCTKLTHITIPENVQSIGLMFGETKLKSLTVDEHNTYFDSRGNCNAIIETATNTLVRGCATTIIPKSVEHIAAQAFWDCVDLKEISIPEGVKTIGKRAFVGCNKLRKVVLPMSLEKVEEDVLFGGIFDSYVKQIIVPKGHKERFLEIGLKEYERIIIEQ